MVNKRVRNAVPGCNLKNDRIISVHFQGKPFNITVIQVYAPTNNAEEAEVEWFYEDLQDLLELTRKKDVLFIIGDWNAKVGSQETPGCCCCCVASVMCDSVRPHRRQPTGLLRPWDSPGKNTGVGCHFLFQCMKVKSESEVAQSSPTLSDPMDCSPPGSSVHGIFQARVLEWGAIAFSEKHLE